MGNERSGILAFPSPQLSLFIFCAFAVKGYFIQGGEYTQGVMILVDLGGHPPTKKGDGKMKKDTKN
jgi:hypothetical protein